MCIQTISLGTALLPKFSFDLSYDVKLLQLISAYQKTPGTETYDSVQNYLVQINIEKQSTLDTFNNDKVKFTVIRLHIADYEDNLLWSTAPLYQQDKIVLLTQSVIYTDQSTNGAVYKKFEDGSEFSLSVHSGAPLFLKGGALRFLVSIGSL
jgi:hypothetical protein